MPILDSDDYWAPEKLDVQVDFLEKNPDIGLVYTNGYAVNAEGEIIYRIYDNNHEENNDADAVLLDCYILLPQNSLVRKSVYDKAGFFEESYRSAQDHDMLIRIAEITRFAYLPDFLFFYRRHPGASAARNRRCAGRPASGFSKVPHSAIPTNEATLRKRKAVLNYRHWQGATAGTPLPAGMDALGAPSCWTRGAQSRSCLGWTRAR